MQPVFRALILGPDAMEVNQYCLSLR